MITTTRIETNRRHCRTCNREHLRQHKLRARAAA